MDRIHRHQTRVRYKETDRMGVVHHANYIVYFEMGRTEFMRAAGISYRALENEGFLLAVTTVEVNYRARGEYEDPIVIETWIEHVSSIRIRFAYRVFRATDQRLLADGRTGLACVDRAFKPTRLPRRVASVARDLCLPDEMNQGKRPAAQNLPPESNR